MVSAGSLPESISAGSSECRVFVSDSVLSDLVFALDCPACCLFFDQFWVGTTWIHPVCYGDPSALLILVAAHFYHQMTGFDQIADRMVVSADHRRKVSVDHTGRIVPVFGSVRNNSERISADPVVLTDSTGYTDPVDLADPAVPVSAADIRRKASAPDNCSVLVFGSENFPDLAAVSGYSPEQAAVSDYFVQASAADAATVCCFPGFVFEDFAPVAALHVAEFDWIAELSAVVDAAAAFAGVVVVVVLAVAAVALADAALADAAAVLVLLPQASVPLWFPGWHWDVRLLLQPP